MDGHGQRLGEYGLLVAEFWGHQQQRRSGGHERVAEAATQWLVGAWLRGALAQHTVATLAGRAQLGQAASQAVVAAPPAHDAVAHGEAGHGRSDFDDRADHLVAEVDALVGGQGDGGNVQAGVEEDLVQVTAADAAEVVAYADPVSCRQRRIREVGQVQG